MIQKAVLATWEIDGVDVFKAGSGVEVGNVYLVDTRFTGPPAVFTHSSGAERTVPVIRVRRAGPPIGPWGIAPACLFDIEEGADD